ncbi:MAG: hypothetical protein Q4C99_06025 [Clostridia bacterium]|nr:hypothetical protein [Clostridia bacterium]
MKFRLFDIEFEISFWFFAMVCTALFANNYDFLYVLLFSSLHELGHITSLYLLGGKADKIIVSFYGIGLKHSSDLTVSKEVLFLLSGIAVNFVFVIFNVKRDINLALIVINALPIYPLDMGRCLKLVLEKYFNISVSYFVLYAFGFAALVLLICYSIYSRKYSILIVSAYLAFWLFRGNL